MMSRHSYQITRLFASVASALENATAAGLASVMKYHVVQGKWPDFYIGTRGWTFGRNTTLTTMNGESISITRSDGTTFVNSAQIITPNYGQWRRPRD
jgi:uncharacterized surface protein with fasciclin (FAS1) repeats